MRENHKILPVVLAFLAVVFLLPCLLLVIPLAGKPLDALWGTVTSPDYLQGYGNTLILAIGSVVLQTAVAVPAGYVLARSVSSRVRWICLVLCGLLMLLPQQALMLWFGSSRIDREIFDAAACDGAAGMTFSRRIYLPLMAPYLATAALLSMAESWNLLEQPMIFLQQKTHYPLSILLSRLPEADPAQKLFGGVLFLLPLVVVFGVICGRIRKNSGNP